MKWFLEFEVFSCSTFMFKKKVKYFFHFGFFWCSDHFDSRVSPALSKEESKKCLLCVGNGPWGVLFLSFPRKGGEEEPKIEACSHARP